MVPYPFDTTGIIYVSLDYVQASSSASLPYFRTWLKLEHNSGFLPGQRLVPSYPAMQQL